MLESFAPSKVNNVLSISLPLIKIHFYSKLAYTYVLCTRIVLPGSSPNSAILHLSLELPIPRLIIDQHKLIVCFGNTDCDNEFRFDFVRKASYRYPCNMSPIQKHVFTFKNPRHQLIPSSSVVMVGNENFMETWFIFYRRQLIGDCKSPAQS